MDEVVGRVEILGFIGNRCPFPGRKGEGEKGSEGERAKDRGMPEPAGQDADTVRQDPSPPAGLCHADPLRQRPATPAKRGESVARAAPAAGGAKDM